MARRPTHSTESLGAADVALLLMALVGVAVYFFLLPGQHPESVGDQTLGADAAQERAEDFLQSSGRSIARLTAHVEFKRSRGATGGGDDNQPLLSDVLQGELGRTAWIDDKDDLRLRVLPVYHWQVRWVDADEEPLYTVRLDEQGTVFQFENKANRPDELRARDRFDDPGTRLGSTEYVRPNRDALQSMLQALWTDSTITAVVTPDSLSRWLESAPDSILSVFLRFDRDTTLNQQAELSRLLRTPNWSALTQRIQIGPEGVKSLAQHHLDTIWAGIYRLAIRPDSVRRSPVYSRTSVVHFSVPREIAGQKVRAEVGVHESGALKSFRLHFMEPTAQRDLAEALLDWNDSAFVTSVQIFWILALGVTLIVLFFRRLIAKSIDIKSALIDGLIVGLTFAAFTFVSATGPVNTSGATTLSAFDLILKGIVAISLIGGLTAILTFLLSGAADSVARQIWPEKVQGMTLVRHAAFFNKRIGNSLVRGVLLAYAALGLMTLTLVFTPDASVSLDSYNRIITKDFSAIVTAFTLSSGVGFTMLVFALLGVGTFFAKRKRHGALIVPVIAVNLTLLQAFPMVLLPGPLTWVQTLVFSTLVAWVFWRYDFVTTFVLVLFAWVFWTLSGGWLLDGSPVFLDFAMSHAVAGGLLVFGLAGALSKRTGLEALDYTPPYVQEVAHQERMKRELELAHQVQLSFLPRRMPKVDGLDLAGMCLAAQEVGGDYFDLIDLGDGRLAMVIGDVSGKGIKAAFFMTLTKGFIRSLCRTIDSPAEVLRQVNSLFCENTPRGTFISMIYGIIDVPERTFTFARAGHNPLIVKRTPNAAPDMMQPDGMAIGLISGGPFDTTIQEKTLNLRVGDVLVFYTDGFSEAMNRHNDLYGDDRLANKVGEVSTRSASGILRAVTEDVHHFVEATGRNDDMTMIVAKLTGRTVEVPKIQVASISSTAEA
ncbi:MAG: PP2C family protein-serine/threonine phosphatase [Bacteroidota bacterium]